jgi:hypothetical protein
MRLRSTTPLLRPLTAAMTLALAPAPAGAGAPTVTGPVSGGSGRPFLASTTFDLAPHGYVEEEFFVEGTASAYTSAGELGSDGKWTVAPGSSAAYRTRILVRRPAERRKFNGAVVVEWHNVSAGLDAAPDWTFTHTMLMREGFAWVGVSAQAAGVEGGGGFLDLSLKTIDPERYGSLMHPGDSFSYDIFSQVGEAIRSRSGLRPLGELRPKRLIAVGESQSAFRLVTYVNAVHPLARVYDGFLIHSRAGGAAALSQDPEPAIPAPGPALVRTDVGVPVLTFQTETDLALLGSLDARQPDRRNLRLWEVAGTAHGDTYQTEVGPGDEGEAAADTTHLPPTNTVAGGFITCDLPINAGPQHYVLAAALQKLERWVQKGIPAPRAPRLEVAGGEIVRDERGNALGGIRTPQLDVPVAALSGLGQMGSAFCFLFGTTAPFDEATLAALYPSHEGYVAAVRRAARAAVRRGFLLRTDAKAIVAAAEASSVGE